MFSTEKSLLPSLLQREEPSNTGAQQVPLCGEGGFAFVSSYTESSIVQACKKHVVNVSPLFFINKSAPRNFLRGRWLDRRCPRRQK